MTRDPRYDILFEPVRIGPVTARNRFYQVPHCTGIGWTQPETLARLRGIKAEGGWAVVATEETEIHPTADCEPFHEGRLWDDRDIPAMALMADAVHEHGALAAIEIMHHGGSVANWGTRLAPMAPSHRPIIYNYPVQARAMDKQDIRDLRALASRRGAALEEGRASTSSMSMRRTICRSPSISSQRRKNDRIDEYGGSLENRARLLRELIEDTKDAVGDTCAVAVRFRADELIGEAGLTHDGEARDVDRDARRASRPVGRQHLELAQRQPDLALRQGGLPGGIYELREAADDQAGGRRRPLHLARHDGVADQARRPRLHRRGAAVDRRPVPAEEDRGRAGSTTSANASAATCACRATTRRPTCAARRTRRWARSGGAAGTRRSSRRRSRKGRCWWSAPVRRGSRRRCRQRGAAIEVHLAEATSELGGRVSRESKLPGPVGMGARARLARGPARADGERLHLSRQRAGGRACAGIRSAPRRDRDRLGLAARWRRARFAALPSRASTVQTSSRPTTSWPGRDPEDGAGRSSGTTTIITWAECLPSCAAHAGLEVTLVTPAATVSAWTANTLEALPIAKRIARLGIDVRHLHQRRRIRRRQGAARQRSDRRGDRASLPRRWSPSPRGCPSDGLYLDLEQMRDRWEGAGIASVTRIGDCWAPSTIQQAVYTGHKWARGLDEEPEGLIAARAADDRIRPREGRRVRVASRFSPCAAATQADARARDLGIPFEGTPGPLNAITDVRGVEVGQKTLIEGADRPHRGDRHLPARPCRPAARLRRLLRPQRQRRDDRPRLSGGFRDRPGADRDQRHQCHRAGLCRHPAMDVRSAFGSRPGPSSPRPGAAI